MNKKILAIVALTLIILSVLSACSKPDNSANGNPVVPGAVTSFE